MSFAFVMIVAVFALLTLIVTAQFDSKAMTAYYYVFLIVGGFPCWEEVQFVMINSKEY